MFSMEDLLADFEEEDASKKRLEESERRAREEAAKSERETKVLEEAIQATKMKALEARNRDADVMMAPERCMHGWPRHAPLDVPPVEGLSMSVGGLSLLNANQVMGLHDQESIRELSRWISHDAFQRFGKTRDAPVCQMLFRIVAFHSDPEIVANAASIYQAFLLNRQEVVNEVPTLQSIQVANAESAQCWAPTFKEFMGVLKACGFREQDDNSMTDDGGDDEVVVVQSSSSSSTSSSSSKVDFPVENLNCIVELLRLCVHYRPYEFPIERLCDVFRVLCRLRLDAQTFEISPCIERCLRSIVARANSVAPDKGVDLLVGVLTEHRISRRLSSQLILLEALRSHEACVADLVRRSALKLLDRHFSRSSSSGSFSSSSSSSSSPSFSLDRALDLFDRIDYEKLEATERSIEDAEAVLRLFELALDGLHTRERLLKRFLGRCEVLRGSLSMGNPLREDFLRMSSLFSELSSFRPSPLASIKSELMFG